MPEVWRATELSPRISNFTGTVFRFCIQSSWGTIGKRKISIKFHAQMFVFEVQGIVYEVKFFVSVFESIDTAVSNQTYRLMMHSSASIFYLL